MSRSAGLPIFRVPSFFREWPLFSSWLVPSLTLAVFVNFLAPLALGAFLPAAAAGLGVSVSLLGQVPAVMMFLAALLGLVVGPLADRFGYRRMLFIGLFTVAISTAGIGLAPTFLLLMLVTLVGAVGRAAVLPVGQAILGTHFPDDDRRRSALSIIQTGQSGAAVLGIPLLTAVATFRDWRAAFFVLAMLALVLLLPLAREIAPDRPQTYGPTRLTAMLAPYGPLVKDRASLALVAAAWLGNGAFWIMATYLAAFYIQQEHLSTQQVGAIYLVAGLGVVVGQLLAGGPLGRRPRLLVIVSRALSGCLMGAALLLPISAPLSVVPLTLGMLANGAGNVATVVLLSKVASTGRATTLAINGSAVSLGAALGGALGGLLIAVGGYSMLGLGSLVLALLAAGVVWWPGGRRI